MGYRRFESSRAAVRCQGENVSEHNDSQDQHQQQPPREVHSTTVVESSRDGSPFAWVVIVIIIAAVVFGAWWLFMRGGAGTNTPEGGIGIEIEQRAPEADITVTGEDDGAEEVPEGE